MTTYLNNFGRPNAVKFMTFSIFINSFRLYAAKGVDLHQVGPPQERIRATREACPLWVNRCRPIRPQCRPLSVVSPIATIQGKSSLVRIGTNFASLTMRSLRVANLHRWHQRAIVCSDYTRIDGLNHPRWHLGAAEDRLCEVSINPVTKGAKHMGLTEENLAKNGE